MSRKLKRKLILQAINNIQQSQDQQDQQDQHAFSLLHELNNYKTCKGYFKFKMQWPDLTCLELLKC